MLTPGVAASVGVAKTGNDVTVGAGGTLAFAAGSDLAIVINGPAVDTQYHQLNVVGMVNLAGVDLALSGTYTPTASRQFRHREQRRCGCHHGHIQRAAPKELL